MRGATFVPTSAGTHIAPTMATSGRQRRRSTLLADATKGAVCAAAGVSALYAGAPAAVALGGALGNAALAKALKRLLRVPRPPGSTKGDHGMPSSHAASLFYLARASGRAAPAAAPALAASAVVASAWRVRCGYHSATQVCAGAVQGVVVEAAFHIVVARRALAALEAHSAGAQLAVVALVLVVGAVAMYGKEALQVAKKMRAKRNA